MAFQFSTLARNAALDSLETAVGAAPLLVLRTGPAPADCAAPDSGTLLATLPCPPDWLAAASGGSKAQIGPWQATATASGTAGHFRILQAGTCHIQGSITATGEGGDMTLDNPALGLGQQVQVTSFTLTAGGV
jgi:hypothetical protein